MQNLRNKNIPVYCLISGVMETIILYKGTTDKAVFVLGEGEREQDATTKNHRGVRKKNELEENARLIHR